MGSDCVNRIDQWQEWHFEEKLATAEREFALMEKIGYNSVRLILEFEVWDRQHDGFMERLDRYLAAAWKHGISAMLCLSNECAVRTPTFQPAVFGEQLWQPGFHGGREFGTWYAHGTDCRYNILDDPEAALRYYRMVHELISTYARDERVCVWNLMNEPGNGRGTKSLPHLAKFFEIGREINPDQPLCADVWRGFKNCRATTEIEQFALEQSDVISFHSYTSYDDNIRIIHQLRKLDRPALNTEWLHRIGGQRVQDLFPLYFLEGIGCYNWGFVAGKYGTNEPAQAFWQNYEKNGYAAVKGIDVTKWQHDLFRPGGRFPYDPAEIEVIKRYTALADEDFRGRVQTESIVTDDTL
jgi:hypothetical protein